MTTNQTHDLEKIAAEENAVFLALGNSHFYSDFCSMIDRQVNENQIRMFNEPDMALVNRMIGANYAFLEIKGKVQEALVRASGAATPTGRPGPLM